MRYKGLTLLELLITLAITAILLALAAPDFAAWLNKSRLRAATYELFNDIQLTRSEAIKRGARITLANSGGNWKAGRIIFIDSDEDGVHDSAETILIQRDGFADAVSITGNSPVSHMISYVSSGESRSASGGFQAGTLILCSAAIEPAYTIVISANGRPRLSATPLNTSGCS